ncbi:MazG family protein [Pseudokineococcus sp. 1T1Z-3]|uniref:MazG family protein n=1 Tax=Pseudokineococcus sp. 1T1Z-3 TaxID=3132745 RepID=UPI0030B1A10F
MPEPSPSPSVPAADAAAAPAPPGTRLLELVAVMDRLRSPGGCPWDAEQTHASLAPYALEEAHEVVEAIEGGSPQDLREELGDLLLQVVFHARMAQEAPAGERFDVDDVAAGITAKMVGRHPHVFAPQGGALTAADVEAGWEARKQAEKGRASALDGVPVALPALARAQKLLRRAERAGLLDTARPLPPASRPEALPPEGRASGVGDRLLAVVRESVAEDPSVDVEGELRRAVRALELELRRREQRG